MDDEILINFMGDMKEAVGEIRSASQSTEKHIKSVSSTLGNVREDLHEHIVDIDAHGADAKRQVNNDNQSNTRTWISILSFIIGLCGVLFGLAQALP